MENKKKKKKIVVVGLDNSGKTSIILSLAGKKSLPAFIKVKPTKGVQHNELTTHNLSFNIWDLGGQEAYRKDHLRNFNTNFSGTNKIIYVFDLQDIAKYDLALKYFEDIVNLLKKENIRTINFMISIFLHKHDPDLSETHPEISKEIINKLMEEVKKKIEKTDFFYEIALTSIYTVFEKNIIE